MKLKTQLLRTGMVWTALLLILTMLKPSQLPVVLLILPFILLFFSLYNLWLLVLLGWRRVSSKSLDISGQQRRMGLVSSFLVVLLVVVASLGQLTGRDVLTLTILSVVGYFYGSRYSKQHKTR